MTYPQQPQYAPQPQYPPAQPQYAPQPQPLYAQPQIQAQPPQAQQYAAVVQPQYVPPQPQAAPAPAPIRGSLADAYTQGVRTGGYGNTLKMTHPGYRFAGTVARDMTDLDVTAETDYATKQPKPDGRGGYRMQMTIPLDVQPSAEHPEGKTTMWAKGRLLTAVVHAMIAVGYDVTAGEGLKQGDVLYVDRVADVPTNKGNPAHDFTAVVQRAGAPANPTAPTATTTPTAAPVAASPYPTAPAAAAPASVFNPAQAPQAGQVFQQPAFQPPAQFAPPTAPVAAQAPAASGTPGLVPGSYQDILVRSLTGNNGQGPLTDQEQAILAAGPQQ